MEQRQIKFRAWDKKNKCFLPITPYEWIDGVIVGTNIPQRQAINTFDVSETNCDRKTGKSMFLTLDGRIVNIHPLAHDRTQSLDMSEQYILMQFTSLLDRNGKEIYEGDIVLITMGDGKRQCIVEFKNGGFVVEANGFFGTEEYDVSLIGWAIDEMDSVEILGNIYETPSPLNQQPSPSNKSVGETD